MRKIAVVVPLADGFEEIEAVTIIDVLRRAGQDVAAVGLKAGPVTGAHEITLTTDCMIDEVDAASVKMIVLPGGIPGATNLRDDARVQKLIKSCAERGAFTAAICAAPIALAKAGVHAGKSMTSYPGFEDELKGARLATDRVVVDGKVVTSRGPGTALEFALTLVRLLKDEKASTKLAADMLVAAR